MRDNALLEIRAPDARARLHLAHAARAEAAEELDAARAALSRGAELLEAAEAAVREHTADAAVVTTTAAESLRRWARGGGEMPALDTADAVSRGRLRLGAENRLTTVRAAHAALAADVTGAEAALAAAEAEVGNAAVAVVQGIAGVIALQLERTEREAAELRARLLAIANTWCPTAGGQTRAILLGARERTLLSNLPANAFVEVPPRNTKIELVYRDHKESLGQFIARLRADPDALEHEEPDEELAA